MIIDRILQSSASASVPPVREKGIRSVVKSITWRVVGTLDTIVISYLLTDTLHIALSIGGVELVTKMILYFTHERIWNRITWGR